MVSLFPVSTLNQDHEIVSANISAKVGKRIDHLGKRLRQKHNDVVTLLIAEHIVEGFEAINIEIAGMEADSVLKEAVNGLA